MDFSWSCGLRHTVEPGQFSLPIEVEITPRYQGSTSQWIQVAGVNYAVEGKTGLEHATTAGAPIV